ncbi:MAG TPA: class C beta-lactamase [Chthoniobacterales bacterium]|nr:class C beta-lactamase [Chthoniobacterales bacterium]
MAILCTGALMPSSNGADNERARVEKNVEEAVRPVMKKFALPSMAVGVVLNGETYVFNYGVTSKATGKPVDNDTLFEIGSVSKTFTATVASYAQVNGQLLLSDSVTKYLPVLHGSAFDNLTLLYLGTHMSGGLPLQVPDEVKNDEQLMEYFKKWKPTYTPGTYRTYSNPSIGLLGLITARSMKEDFAALMEGKLFPALGLKNSYINVPSAQMDHYAQGYTDKDEPIRMTPGVLGEEAYGVRTTAGDMARFVAANMKLVSLDARWQRAITDTHIGYYRIGAMTQDLIWEQYSCPAASKELLWGNSAEVSYKANAAEKIDPPSPPTDDVLINKTGSTNGFGTYVAFVPAKKTGVVLLANKRYPNDARVILIQEILKGLIK